MKFYQGKNFIAVMIFTGAGGDEDGYNDKYKLAATQIVENFGASVFVFPCPQNLMTGNGEMLKECVAVVRKYFDEQKITKGVIYACGFSAGAWLVATYGGRYKEITKILAINPVLQINYNKLYDALVACKTKLTMLIGDKDPSFFMFKFVKAIEEKNDKLKVVALENVDHYFTGEDNFKTFISLPSRYFFEE